MKKFTIYLMLCMMVCVFYACEKELAVEGKGEPDTALSIITRSVTEEEVVTYPIAVYIFDSGSKRCIQTETLTSKDASLELELPHGTYDIYAVAGADKERYDLPTQEEASVDTEVTLKDGKEHTDLMTAHSTITLEKEEESILTLGFERQVMQLTNVTIQQVPSDITDVSVSLAPFYQSLKLNGELGNIKAHKISLTHQGQGTWSLAAPKMLLIDSGTASITVTLTKEDGTSKSYTYPCPDELKKNYQISIVGTYQQNNTVNIKGSINGVTWAGSHEISFTFGEDEPSKEEDTPVDDEVPTAHSIYQDCYVLSVKEVTGGHEVVLLYNNDFEINPQNKTEEEVMAEIKTVTDALSINGISEWRLPTEDEAVLIYQNYVSINNLLSSHFTNDAYFYMKEALRSFFPNTSSFLDRPFSYGKYFRPVTTIKFNQ